MRIRHLFMAIAIVTLAICLSTGMVGAVERYAYSASNPGGTWYTMIGGLIKLLNEKLPPEIRVDMVASGGSVQNTRRLATGEADLTMSYSSHLWECWNGKGIMEGRPSDSPRIMFEIYRSDHYFVTLANKGIKTLEDLEGKRVVLGSPGSGTSDNSRLTLRTLGIKAIESELAFDEAARALQDGKVDAIGMSGSPAAGVVELAATRDIYIIPFTDEQLDKIIAQAPFFSKGYMKANTYKGQTKDVPCFMFSVYQVASKSVPEDVVYQMMKIIFSPEGKKYLADVHPQWKPMGNDPEAVKLLGIPYHPGAERFWKEQQR
ncbi:MAG: TAXI family TRAP transporter solute-binding subunit [Betaproteobacteria bacterium]